MRICVVSRHNLTRDPRARALIASLDATGHRVVVVCSGTPEPGLPDGVEIRTVPTRRPTGGGPLGRVLRRLQPPALRRAVHTAQLRRRVAAVVPDLVYPNRPGDVDLGARAAGAPVVRQPGWDPPRRDLVTLAPGEVRWSRSGTGAPAPFHLPGDARSPTRPEPGRHTGTRIAVAYRVTPTSPGRYLVAALRRAGVEVTVLDGSIDWDRVPEGAAAVVVVESPYPALRVTGTNPGVPVLWWAHHGEHHLPANLRLTARYGAGAVLLAHSWHLAHRFPVPVHRFPFAVATELTGEPGRWDRRRHDVAMVGAGVGGSGTRYGRRRRLVETLEQSLPGRTRFAYGLPPEEMAALYADSRVVINEGGGRHHPITMRVFETLGAGALLLTEDLPGTEILLRRDEHYAVLGDEAGAQVEDLLASGEGERIATAGRAHALDHHTYDHRVDELLAIATGTGTLADPPAPPDPVSPLDALVTGDVEVQEIAVFGWDPGPSLSDRAVRRGETSLPRRSIDAVVIGPGGARDLAGAVAAARGYLYASEPHTAAVAGVLADVAPGATVTVADGLLRADLGGVGYRMRTADHPLAS